MCNFSDITTWNHGIKKKSAHEYGQINRSDWGLSTRDFNRGVRN